MSLLAGMAGLCAGLTVAAIVRARWLEERCWHERVIEAHETHLRVQRVVYAERVARLMRFLEVLGVDDLPEVRR